MITINLLPQEYRKKERTPIVLFLPIIAGVATVLSAAAVAVYVHFVWFADTQNKREMLEQTLAQKQPMLKHEKRLLAEEAEFKKRADTIENIAKSRILMTRILDEFVDVVADGDTLGEDGYLIRLKSFATSPPNSRGGRRGSRGKKGAKSGGEVKFDGWALADKDPLAAFNRYHERLQESRTFRENYIAITDPEGRIENFSDGKLPAKGWTIKQTLTLRDPAGALTERLERRQQMAEKDSGR